MDLESFETFDYKFMRRLAYVETRDGVEMRGRSGIWNISQDQLNIVDLAALPHTQNEK